MLFSLLGDNYSLTQLLYSVSVGLIFAAGNIINDIADQNVDNLNKKVNYVSEIGEKKLFRLYLTLNILALILVPDLETTYLFCIAIILLWLYSYYLQKKLLIGNITISILTTCSIGWTYKFDLPINSVFYFSIMCGWLQLIREIIKDIEDQKGDKAMNYNTVPIYYGINTTKSIVYFISIGLCLTILLIQWLNIEKGWNWPFYAVIYLILVFMVRLHRASHPSHYTFLTKLLKLTMAIGTLSLFFI